MCRPQTQKITFHAKSADAARTHRGKHRMVAKGLARVDIGHVYLNHRHGQYGQGIGQGVAVVRPGSGVDDNRIYPFGQGLMDAFNHGPFVIGLKARNSDVKIFCKAL